MAKRATRRGKESNVKSRAWLRTGPVSRGMRGPGSVSLRRQIGQPVLGPFAISGLPPGHCSVGALPPSWPMWNTLADCNWTPRSSGQPTTSQRRAGSALFPDPPSSQRRLHSSSNECTFSATSCGWRLLPTPHRSRDIDVALPQGIDRLHHASPPKCLDCRLSVLPGRGWDCVPRCGRTADSGRGSRWLAHSSSGTAGSSGRQPRRARLARIGLSDSGRSDV